MLKKFFFQIYHYRVLSRDKVHLLKSFSMGEMMTLMLSGRKKNSVLNRLTKHLLQSCSMHNTSLYISWGQKKKNYKMLGGDSSNGSRLPVFCLCTTVPANRKCLITGAAYTYHYSLAHLVSSVALWHPHCGFTTFLYSSARLQALHLQMFSSALSSSHAEP